MMRDAVPIEVRELMLYCRPGESASEEELARRRNAMWASNPLRAREYRTASLSVKHWRQELCNQSSATMPLAEAERRVAALLGERRNG